MKKKLLFKKILNFKSIFLLIIVLSCSSLQAISNVSNETLQLQQILQQKTVTINIKNSSVKTILYEIQKQSGLNFMFKGGENSKELQNLSLDVKNVTIQSALEKLFAGTAFTFSVNGNTITILERQVSTQNEIVEIKGVVVDSYKQPVVGATIIVLTTTTGALTDSKGLFSLKMKKGLEIEISCMGLKTIVRRITDPSTNMVITMESDAMAVEDVVVNGVFERKAGTFTGSVTTIKGEELKRVGNSNVLQALRNIDPSVMFFDNMELGSDPNAMPSMAMRGKSSIAMDDVDLKATYQNDPNAPLFVLDGFEVSIQKIMDLDMNRVETMTILKDASAKAIYGSKAANGVIVIELKKNASGRLRVTYNGSMEIQAPDLTSYDLTNAIEKLDVERAHGLFYDEDERLSETLAKNKLYNQRLTFIKSGIDTDWMSKPLQTGIGTKHGVSVELGDSDLKSIIDLSYNNVKGVMKGSDRTNISGGVSINYRHKKFLFRNQLTINSNVSNDSKYGSFSEYAKLNPYYTPYDLSGNISQNIIPQLDRFAGQDVSIGSWYKDIGYEANPLYNAQLNTILQKRYIDITNNFEFQWQILNSLKLTTRFGLLEKRDKGDDFYPSSHLKFSSFTGDDEFRKGSYDMTTGQQSNISGKFDIQYNKEVFGHSFFYLNAGYDISEKRTIENIVKAEGFPSEMMNDIMFARQYAKDSKPSGREQTTREMGYYISMNYSYDNRINVDATLRQSASSMYSQSARWGMFWSTGVSWNLHNESWVDKNMFPQMRLRASIGSTGSQSGSSYNSIASFGYYLDRSYEGMLGAKLMGMHNPSLKWQEKNDKNIGIDLNYKSRVTLTFEYYSSITNNALNPITLAPSTGFATVQENVGKIKNTGFDLRATYNIWQRPSDRSFLNIIFALSHNKNVISEISDAMRSFNAAQNNRINSSNKEDEDGNRIIRSKPVNKYYNGVSMDAIWAVKSLGIDPANGDEILYLKDEYGNYYRGYYYDANSQVICGDKLPKVQGNFGFNFEYKGFGLSCIMRYQFGGQMYNQTLVDKVENANITYNVDRRIFTDRWRKPGDISPYKKIQNVSITDKNANASADTKATSRFVQDRNEINVSSIQLSYDFFRWSFLKKIGMERMRLAINMNDIYTLSSIEIERGTSYPFARTFNGSLSFTF